MELWADSNMMDLSGKGHDFQAEEKNMRNQGLARPLRGLVLMAAAVAANPASAGAPACVQTSNGWPGPADFCMMFGDTTGNGQGTPIVFDHGTWLTINDEFEFGAPDDRPVVGDWDGDGDVSPGLLSSTGWRVTNQANGGGPFSIDSQGLTGVPLSGDWDGDGKDTLGHYIDGSWVLSNTDVLTASTNGMSTFTLQYGAPGMQPVVGDWNGDGISDFGLYDGVSFYLSHGPIPDLATAQVITPNPAIPTAVAVGGHLMADSGFVGLMVFSPQHVDPLDVVISMPFWGDPGGGSGDSIDIIEIN